MKKLFSLLLLLSGLEGYTFAGYKGCGKDPEGRQEFSQVAGTKTSVLQYPWAMLITKYTDSLVHCSGSLVTPKFGLSAAHCFTKNSPDFVPTDDMSIFFGVGDIKQLTGPVPFRAFKIQKRAIKEVMIHPGYEYPRAYQDVSIVEFDIPVKLTPTVYPVCLPEVSLDPDHLADEQGIVIGYGPHNDGTSLNMANQRVYPEEFCSKSYSPEDASTDNAKLILTELPNGFDETIICSGNHRASEGTCRGDSGGPLLIDELMDGEFTTVQNGVLHGSLQSCSNQKYPAIFSRLSHPDIHNWLFSNMFPESVSDSSILNNGGKDCWNACNKKQGKCAWCGTDGWCCRQGWTGNGCDGTFGGPGNHRCTLKTGSVSCGSHKATTCADCPQGNGASWCHGDCQWVNEQCQSKDICEAIHVTGDTSNSEGGLYLLTEKRASDAPNSPVWKNSAGDHFIFTTGDSYGWRIGKESGLTSGSYYCKSGSNSLPIMSEEWSEPNVCGSDGTVQVKCTKLNDVCVQYNSQDGSQWKTGAESFLNDDSYYCISNTMSLPITEGKQCGSSGSAHIECTKIDNICEAIHVTGDNSTSNSEGGIYLLSDERASAAPNNPVWKNSAGNRFIFTSGGSDGWRIGQESGLTSGRYYCKSGSNLLPIMSEEWSGSKDCGVDGSVQVKCTKLND